MMKCMYRLEPMDTGTNNTQRRTTMIDKLNIYMTTQPSNDPDDDDGDREQQDEDHKGSGHQD